MESLEDKSYLAHQNWLSKKYEKEERLAILNDIFSKNEFREYLDSAFNNPIIPLLNANDSWFTVGDGYGREALWLSPHCKNVLATDIQNTFLELAKQEGYIENFSQQNAENLTLENDSFDFAYCRESYHHFPRPYIAVYEMLRCVKKGIVINEPTDTVIKMPFLLFLCNILDTKKNPVRSHKIWKNRFSFETIGNYVYKVSQREFEKIAMGIGLPAVAFRYSNLPLGGKSLKSLKRLKRKMAIVNFLTKLGIIPYQRLIAVLFKELPNEATKAKLRKEGYYYYELPKNPYL